MARRFGKFASALRPAFLLLLLTTVSLAWFSFDTLEAYKDKLLQISSAQRVLHDLEKLARLSLLELNALADRLVDVERTESVDGRQARREAMREIALRLGEDAAPGAAPAPAAGEIETPAPLSEATRMVHEILATGVLIDQALNRRRVGEARTHWARLTNSGVPVAFAGLIDSLIEDRKRQIDSIRTQAVTDFPYLPELLPVLVLVVVIVSVLLAWRGFVGLSRSAEALHAGARAFASGDLAYRVPKLQVPELSGLAETLNAMAAGFTEHRKSLQETAARLESIIEERTRALTVSNRKLAEVDATRQKLLSDISHEFRTPLTVIRGQADIALRGEGKTEAEYRDAIQLILSQADHATSLVDDLLFIARANAGEPRLQMGTVPVARLVRSLCTEFEASARQRNLAIEQRTQVRNAVVHGDLKRLRQVFAILLDNALRYSKSGGTVEVSVSLADEKVHIEFRDYGIGLSEEEAQLAFDRFYRGERAQAHAAGTGLGLSVARAIVDAHNGSIRLSGKLDVGATAIVILPLMSHFKGTG